MEENKPQKQEKQAGSVDVFGGIWKFFTSLKLTVVVLILLALVSIFGTVIEQTDSAPKNLEMISNFLKMFHMDPSGAPAVLAWLVRLGLTHMYHSWWFVGLLSLLSANITICSLDRFPRVWHMVTRKQGPLTEDVLKTLGQKKELKSKDPAIKDKARAAMKSIGLHATEEAVGDEIHLYAESGKFSRLGVYITHASVIIIFVGAMIGSFWGYKGYVQILEGSSVNSVALNSKPLFSQYGKKEPIVITLWKGASFTVPFIERRVVPDSIPLGFTVRCDKFELAEHQQARFRGMPSDYLSTLTVLDDGKEVLHKRIEVNDPLQYNGIRLYQSSYGQLPTMAAMTIRAVSTTGSGVHDYKMKKGDSVKLEGTPYTMVLNEMAADVGFGPDGQLVAQSDQWMGKGAAALEFRDAKGEPFERVVITNLDPRSQPQKVPYRFTIVNYGGPYYTGLQVSYDPGVWIVWVGCILMVGGILVAFFIFHRRVWVRITGVGSGAATVLVAGSTNKNRHAFEREFKKMVEKLES